MSRTNPDLDKGTTFSNRVVEEYSSQEELDRATITRTNKVAIVDADIIVYWALAATEETDSEEQAKENLAGIVRSFERHLDAKGYLYFISGRGNFRYLISDNRLYKGNRTKEKHKHYDLIKNDFVDTHHAMRVDFMEADDILCILHSEKTILCSIDKDLAQSAGEHYHLKKRESFTVSETEAFEHLWTQALTGDSTDCILGIEGVGPAKAKTILDDIEQKDYPTTVLKEYMRKYGVQNGADLFVENYLLVRMKTSRGEHIRNTHKKLFQLVDMIYNMM